LSCTDRKGWGRGTIDGGTVGEVPRHDLKQSRSTSCHGAAPATSSNSTAIPDSSENDNRICAGAWPSPVRTTNARDKIGSISWTSKLLMLRAPESATGMRVRVLPPSHRHILAARRFMWATSSSFIRTIAIGAWEANGLYTTVRTLVSGATRKCSICCGRIASLTSSQP